MKLLILLLMTFNCYAFEWLETGSNVLPNIDCLFYDASCEGIIYGNPNHYLVYMIDCHDYYVDITHYALIPMPEKKDGCSHR